MPPSFLTIGIIWVNHHTVMAQFERVNRRFLFFNVVLLMCVAFVPFPTRLIAEHVRGGGLQGPALVYGATMTSMSIAYLTLWLYGVPAPAAGRLRPADPSAGSHAATCPGTWIYGGSTLLALASPRASVELLRPDRALLRRRELGLRRTQPGQHDLRVALASSGGAARSAAPKIVSTSTAVSSGRTAPAAFARSTSCAPSACSSRQLGRRRRTCRSTRTAGGRARAAARPGA